MNSEKNSIKRKIISYYVILAACVLVISAITVTLIFTLGVKKPTISLDKPPVVQPEQKDEPEEEHEDVLNETEFIAPIVNMNMINSYTFYKNKTLDCYHFHGGIDLSADQGTAVFATLSGTVESIATGDVLDGTTITLSHANGIKTVYKFVDANENLKVGDSVARGDKIGTVASPTGSEYKDGAHLHFEVFVNGKSVDPEEHLDISIK